MNRSQAQFVCRRKELAKLFNFNKADCADGWFCWDFSPPRPLTLVPFDDLCVYNEITSAQVGVRSKSQHRISITMNNLHAAFYLAICRLFDLSCLCNVAIFSAFSLPTLLSATKIIKEKKRLWEKKPYKLCRRTSYMNRHGYRHITEVALYS